jgi:hypothetical protein
MFRNCIKNLLIITSLKKSTQISCSSLTSSITTDDIFDRLKKFNLKETQFTKENQKRLKTSDPEIIENIVENLTEFGAPWQRITEIIQNYDDLSLFNSREHLWNRIEMIQKLNISSDLHFHLIARNPQIMTIPANSLLSQFQRLKDFFSSKNLNSLLVKSPTILTNNMDSIKYKFSYLYFIMGIKQNEMCATFVFNHSIDRLRERHLFLERAGLFDKPNKKGITKVNNPFLIDIIDTNVDAFLRKAARDLFTIEDYQSFCDYLKEEDFTDELLGFNTGRGMRDTILNEIRMDKHEKNIEK